MLRKFVEGKNVKWVVDLNKQIDDSPLYMDATRIIEDAIEQDMKSDYRSEYGPCYAIECQRIEDYVAYVSDKLNRDNFYKFDTNNFHFFLGSLPIKNQQEHAMDV